MPFTACDLALVEFPCQGPVKLSLTIEKDTRYCEHGFFIVIQYNKILNKKKRIK